MLALPRVPDLLAHRDSAPPTHRQQSTWHTPSLLNRLFRDENIYHDTQSRGTPWVREKDTSQERKQRGRDKEQLNDESKQDRPETRCPWGYLFSIFHLIAIKRTLNYIRWL